MRVSRYLVVGVLSASAVLAPAMPSWATPPAESSSQLDQALVTPRGTAGATDNTSTGEISWASSQGLTAVGSRLDQSAPCPVHGPSIGGTPRGAATCSCCQGELIDWSKQPGSIRRMPPPGIFPVPPKASDGCGTLWDALHGSCEGNHKSGYAPFAINAWPLFDADWRYVDKLPAEDRTLVEELKRIQLNDCWWLGTGGQFWARYMHESDSRLTTTRNTYTLTHVRQYADLWYSDWLRVYGEYVWADSFGETLPPALPDVDRGDILDLFVDVKLTTLGGAPVYVRAGRQELLYGSQRLITPLPWANKRHTFQGVKIFRDGDDWDFDLFWTEFVPPSANHFDQADSGRTLAGAWLTRHLNPGENLDAFYILAENDNQQVQQGVPRSPFQLHTMGSRWSGKREEWLWDVEAAVQFGKVATADSLAGMATAGLGRTWQTAPLTPTVWLYYDYASGDSDPAAGNAGTFNQLFPFGHYYLGWMDLVGRQNIHDLNVHLYAYPAQWLTLWCQYHHFWLAESRDALYNAGGAAYRRDPTGAAGRDVGHELDFVANFHLTRYSDVLVSYNKLFGGGFLKATAQGNRSVDAESLYLMFQQRW